MSLRDAPRPGAVNESMAFADNLRRLMDARGITAAALGPRVGVTPQAVSQWLVGKTSPVGKRLERLAAALGTTQEALFAPPTGMREESPAYFVGAPADEYHRLADVADLLSAKLAEDGLALGQRRLILFAQQALAQAALMDRRLPFEERARIAVEARAIDIRRRLD